MITSQNAQQNFSSTKHCSDTPTYVNSVFSTGDQGPCRPIVFPPLNRQETLRIIKQFFLNRIVGQDPTKDVKILDEIIESVTEESKLFTWYKLFLLKSLHYHYPRSRTIETIQDNSGRNSPTNETMHLLSGNTTVYAFQYITPYALARSLMPALRPGAKQIIMPDGRRLEFSKAKLFALRFIILPLSIILTVLNVIISLSFKICFSLPSLAVLLIWRKTQERRPLDRKTPTIFHNGSIMDLFFFALLFLVDVFALYMLTVLIPSIIPTLYKHIGSLLPTTATIMLIVSMPLALFNAIMFREFANEVYMQILAKERTKALALVQQNDNATDPLQQSESANLSHKNPPCICEQLESSEELSNVIDFALNTGLNNREMFLSGFGRCLPSVVIEDLALSPGNMLAYLLALGVHKMGKDVTEQSSHFLSGRGIEKLTKAETQEKYYTTVSSFEAFPAASDSQYLTTRV